MKIWLAAAHRRDSIGCMRFIALLLVIIVGGPAAACDTPMSCDKCAKQSEQSWNPDNKYVSDRLNRFYSLEDLMEAAYKSNDMAATIKLAQEYLELASAYPCNWNYGNAIHDANRYLGFVALKGGDVDGAAVFLLRAGKSSGSPQLNTFGPELDLADELLQLGKAETVRVYLADIKKFWEMDQGKVQEWLADIDKGGRPRINRFAAAQPGIGALLLIGFTFAWPALVAGGCTFWLRTRIARKWAFALVSVVCGYVVLVLAMWAVPYIVPALMSVIPGIGGTGVLYVFYGFIGAAFIFPLLAALAISRLFVGSRSTK